MRQTKTPEFAAALRAIEAQAAVIQAIERRKRRKQGGYMTVLANSFSINMLPQGAGLAHIEARRINTDEARQALSGGFVNAVGHQDLARVVGATLGLDLGEARPTVVLTMGDILIVAQYRGPRLPAGTTELPPGAAIEFWRVEVTLLERAEGR